MEWFFKWLLENVAWDTLQKALPKAKQSDLTLFKRSLAQALGRLEELEQDRKMLEQLVDQRNRAISELNSIKRQLIEAQAKNRKLEQKLKRVQAKK